MQYAIFETPEQADAYRVRLQAHHDAAQQPGRPRIVDCVCPTWDGRYALTLHTDTWPETTAEIVDSIEPPVVEMPEGLGMVGG